MRFTQFNITFDADEIGGAFEHQIAQAMNNESPVTVFGAKALVGFRQFESTPSGVVLTYNIQPWPVSADNEAPSARDRITKLVADD